MKRKILALTLGICMFIFSGCSNQEEGLQEVTYEMVTFTYNPDRGNGTARLEYQFRFHNPNDFAIRGTHKITINIDGVMSTIDSTNDSGCINIPNLSLCHLASHIDYPHSSGIINSIEFVSIEYTIIQ